MKTWKQSYWYDAQTIHTLAGALILFAGLTHGLYPLTLIICFIGITAIKEFVIDMSAFERDSFAGSLQDFGFYQCGDICGILLFGHFWLGAIALVLTILVIFLFDYFSSFP